MAIHSSTLAWKIPWVEERGRLQSMGLQRVRHDWATSLGHSLVATTLDKADLELAEKFRKEYKHKQYKNNHQSFPVSSAVKNLPASAGDTSPVPGLGRSHTPQTTEPAPHDHWAHAAAAASWAGPCALHWEARTTQSSPPLATTGESPNSSEEPAQPK